jgi:hypothetical protein
MTSGGRYPVLRSLAILYLLGAAVAALVTVVGVLWILARAPYAMTDRLVLGCVTLIGGFFVVIGMLAMAEVFKLFIDIEHNTRMSAPANTMAMTMEVPAGQTGTTGHVNRIAALDEETAEVALIRGH